MNESKPLSYWINEYNQQMIYAESLIEYQGYEAILYEIEYLISKGKEEATLEEILSAIY